MINDKENFKRILNHKQGERLAIDFGSTAVTGMHSLCVENLRNYYGLKKQPTKIIETFQMLGEIDNELLDIMGANVTGYLGTGTSFGLEAKNYKPYHTLYGQDVLVPEKFNTKRENNNEYIYPQGNMNVSPSGVMPESGYFFDAIVRKKEVDDEKLDYKDNIEEFTFITDEDIHKYKKVIDDLSATNKGIIMSFGGTSFGDISLVPGIGLINPKGIRDITEWYMSTITRTAYIHKVFQAQTEIALINLERIYNVIGNTIDAIFICGTDFGTQISQFCSKDTFNELYFPYYKTVNDWIHKNTKWKTLKHSCGAIYPLLPSIIDAGFDIINPVQFSATDMDTKTLKKEFGKDIVFWGGGVDTQMVLPFGSPSEVRSQVLKQCETLYVDGGFVFNTVHNIQATTPVENIVAMIDALKEFK